MERNSAPHGIAPAAPADAARHGASLADLPAALQHFELPIGGHPLCSGDVCPTCGEERLDYDGQLNLTCPRCGSAASGCFT